MEAIIFRGPFVWEILVISKTLRFFEINTWFYQVLEFILHENANFEN